MTTSTKRTRTKKPKTALVLRCNAADMSSRNGFIWPDVGQVAECPDWKAEAECGNGLHGWLYGHGDSDTSPYVGSPDAKWVVVEVLESDIIDLDGKVKFPRGTVRYVGDKAGATAYLTANEPRSANDAVIGLVKTVGDNQSAMGGNWSTLNGGNDSTLTGGNWSTLTGGNGSTLTGCYGSTLNGGYGSTLTGGYGSTLTGGYGSTLTGGDGSTLNGGEYSTLTGGNDSTLNGGEYSTLTGGYGSTLTGGYGSALTGGDGSTLTGGNDSTLTGGNDSTLNGGEYSTLTGGNDSTLTGGEYSTLTGGYGSTLTGGDRSTLTIRWYDSSSSRYRVSIAYVGEDGIESGVAYKLDSEGKFIKA